MHIDLRIKRMAKRALRLAIQAGMLFLFGSCLLGFLITYVGKLNQSQGLSPRFMLPRRVEVPARGNATCHSSTCSYRLDRETVEINIQVACRIVWCRCSRSMACFHHSTNFSRPRSMGYGFVRTLAIHLDGPREFDWGFHTRPENTR